MHIVYLHGFLSSPASTKARLFERQLSGTDMKLEIPDLNFPSFETLTISRVIETAEARLPTKGRGSLIGSSMGGWAAAHLAALHPSRVEALVLMAPAFNMPDLLEERLGVAGMESWRSKGTVPIDHPAFDEPQHLSFELFEDARTWAREAPQVTAPTLILHGRRDEDVPVGLSEAFAKERPNVELVTYDAGHSLEEVVDDVIDRATSFLARHEES